jgi:hypothetical protein
MDSFKRRMQRFMRNKQKLTEVRIFVLLFYHFTFSKKYFVYTVKTICVQTNCAIEKIEVQSHSDIQTSFYLAIGIIDTHRKSTLMKTDLPQKVFTKAVTSLFSARVKDCWRDVRVRTDVARALLSVAPISECVSAAALDIRTAQVTHGNVISIIQALKSTTFDTEWLQHSANSFLDAILEYAAPEEIENYIRFVDACGKIGQYDPCLPAVGCL